MTENTKYQVMWESDYGKSSGQHEEFFSKEDADGWCKKLNREYKTIHHWVRRYDGKKC